MLACTDVTHERKSLNVNIWIYCNFIYADPSEHFPKICQYCEYYQWLSNEYYSLNIIAYNNVNIWITRKLLLHVTWIYIDS